MDYKERLSGNIFKLFMVGLSLRRNYYPLIAVYFLTLPNTTAQQIGIYASIGMLASFLLEIPSGYFSDHFGHKNTLILSKFLMFASTLCIGFGDSLIWFILGSALISAGFAFTSGTASAIMHDTLLGLGRDNEFTKISAKQGGIISLISVFIIIALPFLTKISIVFPIRLFLIFDVMGIIFSMLLVQPKQELSHSDVSESVWLVAKKLFNTGFYPVSVFFGIISGVFITSGYFSSAYLTNIGFPVVFIGSVMGISRLVWFGISNFIHIYENKLSLQKIMRIELILFPFFFFIIAFFQNPYVVGGLFALIIGYNWSRSPIINNYLLLNFIHNKKYKATILSISSQVSSIFGYILSFGIGFVMQISYRYGYYAISGIMLLGLIISYFIAVSRHFNRETQSTH